jgi:hypothetical protein
MLSLKNIYFFAFIIFTFNACGQIKNNRWRLGRAYAEKELNTALTDKNQHNVLTTQGILIKDSITAVNIIEPILFSVYGKDNIAHQRPYECYFINSYWVITGTLPKSYKGGTFLLIMEARDCKIIRLTHGK